MPAIQVPTIETARLLLRPMGISDWPAYVAFMSSERSVHMGGPYIEHSAWGVFCHDTAQWQLFGHGALMLEEKATGSCLGQVGINHGPLFPERELGWFVYEQAEGRGFAHEAAHALRAWAFDERGMETLVSYIDPGNARSRRLAERLGGVPDTAAVAKDPDDLVYRYNR